jgi:membrane associated rhomboid family serine protease
MLLFLTVVAVLVLRKLTAEEKIQLVHKATDFARSGLAVIRRQATGTPAGCEEFYAALHARTRWPLVTPTILIAYVTLYIVMVWDGRLVTDEFLIEWGGSVGPRTTNGEWWRLATAPFLHWGLLHFIASVAGLTQVGRLVERLVGAAAFAVVFVAAGVIAGLQQLSVHPVIVIAGASGAIFGVYGLLLATCVWGWVRRSPLTIPVAVLKRLVPGAVVFLAYTMATEGLVTESMKWGLAVGLAGGGMLAFRIGSHKPPVRRLCSSLAATLALVVVFAAPLRGMADVSREMARVIELETRTAAAYDAEVARFRLGRQTPESLARTADAIASDIHTAYTSLSSLRNIPAEHQPVVDEALAYLQLREQSWRLRVEGLRARRMQTLQRAERLEYEAKARFVEVEKLKSGNVEE